MNTKKICDLTERTVFLEINVIRLCSKLSEELGNSNFPDQLVHYASAIGGNYREAHRTRSAAEYRRILTGIITDIRDLVYFLELLKEVDEGDKVMLERLIHEAGQILLMIQNALDKREKVNKTYVR